jgi:hypothetical protein
MATRAAIFLSIAGARLRDSLAGFTAARRALELRNSPHGGSLI